MIAHANTIFVDHIFRRLTLGHLVLAAFVVTILKGCSTQKSAKQVSVIIYSDFFYPQKNYDSLITDFLESNMIDSVKAVGAPIKKHRWIFQIDSLVAFQYGLEIEELDKKIASIRGKSIEEIHRATLVNKSGQTIPLSAVSRVYGKSYYYRPKVYLPEPSSFKYKDRKAVKIQLYTRKGNKKKLREFISKRTLRFFHKSKSTLGEFEIIK